MDSVRTATDPYQPPALPDQRPHYFKTKCLGLVPRGNLSLPGLQNQPQLAIRDITLTRTPDSMKLFPMSEEQIYHLTEMVSQAGLLRLFSTIRAMFFAEGNECFDTFRGDIVLDDVCR